MVNSYFHFNFLMKSCSEGELGSGSKGLAWVGKWAVEDGSLFLAQSLGQMPSSPLK